MSGADQRHDDVAGGEFVNNAGTMAPLPLGEHIIRQHEITFQPASEYCRTSSKPIPRFAPVTNATGGLERVTKDYSHSMVPGGLLVMSRTTRFTSRTSLVIRVDMAAKRSWGSLDQSAVIASSLDTGRNTIGWP